MKKFLAAILATGILFTGCGNENPVPSTPKKVEQVEVRDAADLGMTFEQFATSLQVNSSNFGMPLSIHDTKFTPGSEKNGYTCNILQNLSLMAAVDKNTGMITIVELFATPKTTDDLLNMVFAYGTVMSILNPELSQDQRGEILQQLYLTPEKLPQLKETGGRVVRGNVKYMTSFIEGYGLFILGAETKDS